MTSSKKLSLRYLAFFIVAFLLTLKYIIPRGLDLTDESLYILNAKYPEALEFGSTYYHVFSSQLWTIAGSIINFRLIGLFLVLLSGFLIGFAAWLLTRKSLDEYSYLVQILSLAGVFSMLHGTLVNYSPSYNLLVLFFASIALSTSLILTSSQNRLTRLTFWVTSSLSLTLATACKPSVLIPLWFLCVMIRASQNKSLRQRIVEEFFALILLTCISIFLYRFILSNYLTISQLRLSLKIAENLQEQNPLLVLLLNVYRSSIQILVAMGFLVVVYLAQTLNLPFMRKLNVFSRLTLAYLLLSFLGLFWIGGSDRWISQSVFLHFSVFFFASLALVATRVERKTKLFLLVLFLFPYSLSVGTNNLYFSQILFYCGSWGVALGVLGRIFTSSPRLSRMVVRISTVMIVVLLLQQVTYLSRNSYGLLLPYFQNSNRHTIQGIGSLLIDKETLAMSAGALLSKERCKVSSRDTLIATDGLSGINVLLNIRPAGAAWIHDAKTLKLISDSQINRNPAHTVWAFRSSHFKLRQTFFQEYPNRVFSKCGQFSAGSREEIELWRLQ